MRKIILVTCLCVLLSGTCFAQKGATIQGAVVSGGGGGAATCANSCSGNYGITDITGYTEISIPTDEMSVYKIALTSSCVGANPTIHGYLKDSAANSNFKLIIYDDDGAAGEPGTLLWVGAATASKASTEWWAESATLTCLTSTNGSVYVGVVADSTFYVFYIATGTSRRVTTAGNYTSPPTTWPAATDTHSDTKRAFYLSW